MIVQLKGGVMFGRFRWPFHGGWCPFVSRVAVIMVVAGVGKCWGSCFGFYIGFSWVSVVLGQNSGFKLLSAALDSSSSGVS